MSEPPSPGLTPSFSLATPEGEDRDRRVCDHCGFVDYVNPKIVVGSVIAWSDQGDPFGPDAVPLEDVRILLCRRAILPRKGYWTQAAGYMEEHETVAHAVRREAQEEALADIELDAILGVYDVPQRSQVQIMYRARLKSPEIGAGPESLEAKLFRWSEIPWKALAFHSVSWSLMYFEQSRLLASFPPFGNPPVMGWMGPAAG
jgi:ADP-ribose pyrophosphatase YjhB (NUDIX family)